MGWGVGGAMEGVLGGGGMWDKWVVWGVRIGFDLIVASLFFYPAHSAEGACDWPRVVARAAFIQILWRRLSGFGGGGGQDGDLGGGGHSRGIGYKKSPVGRIFLLAELGWVANVAVETKFSPLGGFPPPPLGNTTQAGLIVIHVVLSGTKDVSLL